MQQKTGWMHIKLMNYDIQTEEEYQEALKRFLELCEGPKDDEEIKELYLLMDLMGKYERNNCSIN